MDGSPERSAVILGRHPLWLEALDGLLRRVGVSEVRRASTCAAAASLVAEIDADLFVTDVDFGDEAGEAWYFIRKVSESRPSTKTVVVSESAHGGAVEAAFAAGAAAYCTKAASADDIAVAIRQSFESSIFLARPSAAAGASSAAVLPQRDHAEGILTRREREILMLLAEGHSNTRLARMLWVTDQTVKFHLSNIYRKLGVANRTEASRWAQLHGLLPASTRAA
jgi:DNA-binding NarL/FixJ family response regulator